MRWLLIALVSLVSASQALAETTDRQRALYDALRCVVCEGQALSSSQSAMAIQMRELIDDLIDQGKSDAQIKQYFVERYGDNILMEPPLMPSTYLLWFAPMVLLFAGALLIVRYRRTHE